MERFQNFGLGKCAGRIWFGYGENRGFSKIKTAQQRTVLDYISYYLFRTFGLLVPSKQKAFFYQHQLLTLPILV